ncbi:hypothetical protein PVAND_015229 [Polypedilum vanderplanki]|uniref:Uncharacterized protein n=1 Tax=Polypedilum vanderplanki TaxID=319348 RepID=A0A9J6BC58_POLVA|nr:hypothetical protein PVAND_015229 [Polypedilum vanderplanki]
MQGKFFISLFVANKFYRYYLDDEPAEYGFFAGYYAPGKEAYIGLSIFANMAYQINRLQLDPPGVQLFNAAGPGIFSNDSKTIWYLYHNRRHKYKWVNSSDAKAEPFAIEIGSEQSGFELYIGRIKKENLVMVGVVVPFGGIMFYADENGISHSTTSGYQVLTCRSKRRETKIPIPKLIVSPTSNVDDPSGCVNNWQPYNNDDAPNKNGVSAGFYDCNNAAYVGKGKSLGIFIPGRIQTTTPTGLFLNSGGKEIIMKNGTYYLVDNPNYTYRWGRFDNKLPENAVYVRNDVGNFHMPIARVKVNGRMKIGRMIFPAAGIANDDGIDQFHTNSEILVCDPWPKYKCAQQWKKLNANISVDGFSVDSTSFIGRGTRKCINGCDYGLGKIQSGSNGVNYLDDLTATAVFDNSSNVEYLVKNPSDTYKWQPSRNGVKVVNALELHKKGHRPFYIGMTRINDNVVVGKVRPGDGLFFIDPVTGKQQSTSSYEVLTCTSPDASNGEYEEEKGHRPFYIGMTRINDNVVVGKVRPGDGLFFIDPVNGKQQSTSSYEVLTCTSPDASNGEYEEKSDADWFGSFGCPVRKEWNFTERRCVCRDEFRGVFAASGAKWNEETCSYI